MVKATSDGMKRCSKCGANKSLDEYSRSKGAKDGRHHYCKVCSSERNAARYASLPKHYTPTVTSKMCRRCGTEKPSSEFAQHLKSKDGLQSQCRTCVVEWNANNANLRKDKKLQKNYGITLSQYNEILSRQGERCGCCGTDSTDVVGYMYVDHDHDTGEIRGILCFRCNTGIGMLGDTLESLEKAVCYLKKIRRLSVDPAPSSEKLSENLAQ